LRAYLAGPDIFLSEAVQLTERKKAICARHGLIGISPLDPLPGEPADWVALPEWRRIALRRAAERSTHPVLRSDARQSDAVPWTEC
jgi:nucleoside 2-deoxyribosyltransferase